MLKHLKFSGVFHDDNLSVSVTFENPVNYGLEMSALLFSVTAKDKGGGVAPSMGDFTFYIMDESNHMYNARNIPAPAMTTPADDDEPSPQPDWLILTDFKPEFLYQDLQVAFYHGPYQKINIIELHH